MVKPINHSNNPVPPSGASQPSQTQQVQPDKTTQAAHQNTATHEQLALSSKALLAQKVKAAAHNASGVDAARVRVISQAIANNSYEVSSQEIAKAVAEAAWMVKGK